MGRFIVMDIVFYGSSLNYDQGTGNYQELKKITKWDGRQYTLVSRYALRYSLLQSSNFHLASGDVFTQEKKKEGGGKATIQPKPELLFNGEILKYAEFDLFGFLVTNTDPTNSRESPVKITHAISMTPFNYDTHFCGNHWIAKRALERGVISKMDINLFTKEEHETFYQYSVVVDVDRVGNLYVYTTKEADIKKLKEKLGNKNEGEIILNIDNKELNVNTKINKINDKIWEIRYTLPEDERKSRIETLIRAILNLHREIKGVPCSLAPKLMIVGIYKDKPYKTYKDRIFLKDEYSEESYDEIEEREENGKKIVKVKHVVSKSKKPVFEVIVGTTNKAAEVNDNQGNNEGQANEQNDIKESISEDKVIKFVELLFHLDEAQKMKEEGKDDEDIISKLKEKGINESDAKKLIQWVNEGVSEVKVFHDPSIKVEIK